MLAERPKGLSDIGDSSPFPFSSTSIAFSKNHLAPLFFLLRLPARLSSALSLTAPPSQFIHGSVTTGMGAAWGRRGYPSLLSTNDGPNNWQDMWSHLHL